MLSRRRSCCHYSLFVAIVYLVRRISGITRTSCSIMATGTRSGPHFLRTKIPGRISEAFLHLLVTCQCSHKLIPSRPYPPAVERTSEVADASMNFPQFSFPHHYNYIIIIGYHRDHLIASPKCTFVPCFVLDSICSNLCIRRA